MTPEQFAYWMQGFAELNALPPSHEQWQSIREHLALVFEKKTPEFKPNPSLGIPRSASPSGTLAKRMIFCCAVAAY